MISETGSQRLNFLRFASQSEVDFQMQHLSMEIHGFSNEKEALDGGLREGYYGGYFEHHVIRDMSYGLWTDARSRSAKSTGMARERNGNFGCDSGS